MAAEHVDDLIEGEPELLHGAGHPDAFHGRWRVVAVAEGRRCGVQPAAFVEADGVDAHLGVRGDLADFILHGEEREAAAQD